MKKKKKLLVISVTSYEALLSAIDQNTCIMGIEDPLYTEFVRGMHSADILHDYDMEEHSSKGFILARKVRGNNCFDEEKYDFRYLLYDLPY